jgi:hypothetical protein
LNIDDRLVNLSIMPRSPFPRRTIDILGPAAACVLVWRCRRRAVNATSTVMEKKMLRKLALAVLAVVVVILGVAATKPDNFTVRRVASIKAPPEKIAALITDFHQWSNWSPWEKLDPAMKRSFTGATAGKGAIYEWEGNKDVGKGRMEITDAATPEKTVVKLDFLKPLESHSTTVFTLVPQGGETEVSWEMAGPMPFVSKIMSVFMNMDALIGKDFEKGLAGMKAAAEK